MREPCFLPPLRAKLVWWGILQKQEDVECEHLLLGDENLFLSYLTGNGCSLSGEWSSEMIGKEASRLNLPYIRRRLCLWVFLCLSTPPHIQHLCTQVSLPFSEGS